MDRHTQSAIRGSAEAPLSSAQKRELIVLALKAYAMEFPPPDLAFVDWRHRQCLLCVERRGLTECCNEDYLPLQAHFLRLVGKSDVADRLQTRAACEPRTWARARLERECTDAADVLPHAREYAAGFLRNARKVQLEDASEKQIWHAIYVVRRRAAQLRRRARP